ncbi:uncharacterized protein QC761_102800 [Podospora bellae-mahoneyi]|uniref:Transcription factor Pcc1 n=1 Tax=Podospora bellae-mahoneyi TaxID=2093777 RepID=A0ABR0FUF7_9PEZI|nr:hypothetical protein QC761_102800 [Podospora bellae-mahoneyi]
MSTELTYPCSLSLDVPFPDARLANVALQALRVDKELSALVQKELSAVDSTLKVRYKATTNRMLRVAVNSFFDSLALVLEVMEQLDVDVIETRKAEEETG